LSGLAIMVYMRIDQIMLGQMVGDKAVGLYSAATRICEVWYFIPTAITSSYAPEIYASRHLSDTIYYEKLRKLIRLLSLVSITLILPISLLSGTIVTLLYGNNYSEAIPILRIQILSSWFTFVGVGASPFFNEKGLTYLSFQRTLIGAIMNIILNLFLIPQYSSIGAATATVISYGFGSVFVNAFNVKTRKVFFLQIKSLLFL
ncbi:MAG: polysaccharide biosynthesis C-terminal domain-containing protein, partial [Dolichospermum sp.]